MNNRNPSEAPLLIEKVLADLKNSGKLCEIIMENPADSIYCQVIAYNEYAVLIRKVLSDNGDYDGYSLAFSGNIKSIAWEGEMLQQLEILLEDKAKDKKFAFDKISQININNDFFKVIKTINSLFGHLSVYETSANSDFYFGQVKDIDEYFLLMRLMGDKNSMDDCSLLLRLEDIGRIDFGGIYDESMLRLHQIKKKIRKQ